MAGDPDPQGAHGGALVSLFFGPQPRRLVGVFHRPHTGADPRLGVVLCYPVWREYLRAHRAFFYLASRLASDGIPALRFDYFGTGDSAGNGDEGTLALWRADICVAIDEFRKTSAVDAVCLFGCRLGANMALAVAQQRDDVMGVILWDPVTDGKRYLNTLRSQHAEMLRGPLRRAGKRALEGRELLGFELSDAMVEELPRVRLVAPSPPPPFRVLLLQDAHESSRTQLWPGADAGDWLQRRTAPCAHLWRLDGSVPLWSCRDPCAPVLDAVSAWLDSLLPRPMARA